MAQSHIERCPHCHQLPKITWEMVGTEEYNTLEMAASCICDNMHKYASDQVFIGNFRDHTLHLEEHLIKKWNHNCLSSMPHDGMA